MADAILSGRKICTGCNESLSLSDFGKNKNAPLGLRARCKACRSIENRNWRTRNPGYSVAYHEKNSADRPRTDEDRLRQKHYFLLNRARILAQGLRWAKENPERAAARAMQRIATKNRATPAWADQALILEFYKSAERLRVSTATQWHVDHIVPLNSKLVCGLHVQGNLQVIPATENLEKSNSYWPDMP